MKNKISVSRKELYRLYIKKKQSSVKIADIFNCNHGTIIRRLVEMGIPLRYRRIKLAKKEIEKLYYKERKSVSKISKIYKCSSTTITNRLKYFNIPLKTKSQARIHYPRHDFRGNLLDKSYLIGFRIGDLRVYKTKPHAETVIVQCHTTQNVQILLLKDMFNKYGKVSVGRQKDGSFDINCYLNETFEFLLPKRKNIDSWIKNSKNAFVAFLAGYIDAEGNFIINQGKARFKIDSYDKIILRQAHQWLCEQGINSKFRLIGKKREMRPTGYSFNKDLWRLNINEANSLFRFINMIGPFIRHKKRFRDINICLENIKARKQKGTIK